MRCAAATVDPHEAYRRQARRLRCRLAGRPGALYQSLQRLANEATPSAAARLPRREHSVAPLAQNHPASVQSGPARAFAGYLIGHMPAGSVLRYSQRLEFLRAARRFGVGRFEANLLIAAVLRQRCRPVEEPDEPDGGLTLSHLTALLLVESAVLLGAWWLLFH